MEPQTRPLSRFRAAIACQAWAEAERLLPELWEEIEGTWNQSTSEAERIKLQAEVSEAFEWARCVAETSRAHARGKLIRMKQQRAYIETPVQPGVVGIEG